MTKGTIVKTTDFENNCWKTERVLATTEEGFHTVSDFFLFVEEGVTWIRG